LVSLARSRAEVIEIESTTELSQAFSILSEAHVSSAPVRDTTSGKYVGFLDVRDLTSFLVHFGQHVEEGNYMVADICAAGAGSVLDNVTVTYLARRNPFRGMAEDATVGDAVASVAANKIKRVAIVDEAGSAKHIISLSDLVQFFSTNLEVFPEEFVNATAGEMFGADVKTVLTAQANDSVLDALTILDSNKITGIAIVDPDSGAMVSNISGKDLRRLIKAPSYEKLNMPVVDMIKALRQESQVDIATPTITVFPSTFTHHVIAKLAATKVHRVYIVGSDADYRPIGVITQTSILKKIATLLDQSE